MPVSSQTPVIAYNGNGVTTSFPFTFAILDLDDLFVKVNGAVVSTGFSVTLNANQETAPGGSVVFVSAPAAGTGNVVIYRDVALTRATDYQEGGDLLAATLDADLDRLWHAMQDRAGLASRTLRLPVGETCEDLSSPTMRANKVLGFDESGSPGLYVAEPYVLATGTDVLLRSVDVTSDVSAGGIVARDYANASTWGYVWLGSGDLTHSGYLDFRRPGGTRCGYIGHAISGEIAIHADSGWLYRFVGDAPRSELPATHAEALVRKQEMDALVTASVGGAFAGLAISCSGTSASVAITADEVLLRDGFGVPKVVTGVNLTLNTAGSGANGLDTGALSTGTWYYVWIISNGSTTAALASLSSTAPTMPGGYTYKRRVGAIKTDGTGNKYPLKMVQYGRRAQWAPAAGTNLTTAPAVASGGFGPGNAQFRGIHAPMTAAVARVVSYSITSTNCVATVGPSSVSTHTYLANTSTFQLMASAEIVLESDNLYILAQANAAVYAAGWEDNL